MCFPVSRHQNNGVGSNRAFFGDVAIALATAIILALAVRGHANGSVGASAYRAVKLGAGVIGIAMFLLYSAYGCNDFKRSKAATQNKAS